MEIFSNSQSFFATGLIQKNSLLYLIIESRLLNKVKEVIRLTQQFTQLLFIIKKIPQ